MRPDGVPDYAQLKPDIVSTRFYTTCFTGVVVPDMLKGAFVVGVRHGRGLAGVYPWEVAETKAETVISLAREAGYPLQAVVEDA